MKENNYKYIYITHNIHTYTSIYIEYVQNIQKYGVRSLHGVAVSLLLLVLALRRVLRVWPPPRSPQHEIIEYALKVVVVVG